MFVNEMLYVDICNMLDNGYFIYQVIHVDTEKIAYQDEADSTIFGCDAMVVLVVMMIVCYPRFFSKSLAL